MPTYMAKYLHSVIEQIERTLGADERVVLDGRLRKGHLDSLKKKSPVETVDGSDVVAVFGALRSALGDERYVRWWREYTQRRLMQLPLLKTMIDTLIKVFQPTPHMVLRQLPRARGALVKGGGEVTYTMVSPTSARLSLSGYPPRLLEEGVAGLTMAGVYEGVVAFIGQDATAVVEREDVAAGAVVHHVSW